MTDNKDICEDCGTTIPKQTMKRDCGLFAIKERVTVCPDCAYGRYFRSETCCKKPFKEPVLRRKADGSFPDAFALYVQHLAEQE
jgi:hypothetical protein